jgi:hypothetical protein
VEARDVSDSQLSSTKNQAGVPDALQTCHTAVLGNYIIEGHVPAEDIQRLLKDKPAIVGIAVAGMPIGSPGMEQGARKDPFNTIAFSKNGPPIVFARH